MKVQYRQNHNRLIGGLEVNGVWERVEQSPTNAGGNLGKLERSRPNASEKVIDGIHEPQTQSCVLCLVPVCRRLDVQLRQRLNDPPALHLRV